MYVEKSRPPEGRGWFVALIAIVSTMQVVWGSFQVVLFLLSSVSGVQTSEVTLTTFFTSSIGVVAGVTLLAGSVWMLKHSRRAAQAFRIGCGLFIFKNVADVMLGFQNYVSSGDPSSEALHIAAFALGLDLAQLIFWAFVLWLSSYVLRQSAAHSEKPKSKPRLMGGQ